MGDGRLTLPVITVRLPHALSWEPADPDGCRCLCRLYHPTGTTCTRKARPGLLVRLDCEDGAQGGPWAVCAPCHAATAAQTDTP